MTDLRETVAGIITAWAEDGCEEVPQDVAGRILEIPEIAEALRFVPVKRGTTLGHSISTKPPGGRTAD